MKKISLKNLNLKEVEQLSREQLKDVLGGWTGGTGQTGESQTEKEPKCNCNTRRDCPLTEDGKTQLCGSGCDSEGTSYVAVCSWSGEAD